MIVTLYWLAMQTAAYARVGFPNLDDPQESIPMVIRHWMPIGIKGLSLALILSACQTTMATIWNNNVSIITNDIYKRLININASEKKLLLVSRIITAAVAIFTIVTSIWLVDQIISVVYFANIFMAALFFPVLGGFFWWKTGKKAAWASAGNPT